MRGRKRLPEAPTKLSTKDNLMLNQFKGVVDNVLTTRRRFFEQAFDPRRDIDKEAGYPTDITPEQYKRLYEREGISTRIVEIFPLESWKEAPSIIETEEGEQSEFEEAVKTLDREHNFFHFLAKIDELSGIGRFGVLLMGINDGKELREPVEGVPLDGRPTGEFTTNSKKIVGNAEHGLIYLRAFDESCVEVNTVEGDMKSPRFGKPISYNIQFKLEQGIRDQHAQIKSTQVHWHRVIHVADNTKESDIFGMPRLQKVFNRMLDLRKLLGGSAEMFWKGAFPGYSFEVDPALQGTVTIDKVALREELENYMNGLQRYLANEGLHVKSLAPQVAEPNNHFDTQIKAVSIAMGIPMRILMGSEQAKLASSQDSRTWNTRIAKRQDDYVSPLIIRPFIDRMMAFNILPVVEMYLVVWPDLNALTDEEISQIGKTRTEALAKYVQGGVTALIPPHEFFTIVLGFSDEQAEAMIKAAAEQATLIDAEEETRIREGAANDTNTGHKDEEEDEEKTGT